MAVDNIYGINSALKLDAIFSFDADWCESLPGELEKKTFRSFFSVTFLQFTWKSNKSPKANVVIAFWGFRSESKRKCLVSPNMADWLPVVSILRMLAVYELRST